MDRTSRTLIIIILCELMAMLPACKYRPPLGAPPPAVPQNISQLQADLRKPYLDIFQISPGLHFSDQQISEMKDHLKKGQIYCVSQFKGHADKYGSNINNLQSQLRRHNGEEHALKCQIEQFKILKSQAHVLATDAIPVAYENRQAKLKLIQKWPGELKQIKHNIDDGSYKSRKWGDVKDIGFRKIAPGQQNDIRLGRKSVEQMRRSGELPPEIKDPDVVSYVNSVAQKVAAHSDLHVPLHVTVLDTKEINAFAMPGGFLFVERGLLEAADNESELAGVLGHEIAHDCARHGHKMMHKQTITSILFQAAQVASLIFTGGVSSIGTYYALQYGFYGLGLLLNLNLLGVSREFELQADKLGIQYAWNSDYDPRGFIKFFDKMASKEGYVEGVSWFHTHPPFYTRMVDAEKEILYLPNKQHYIVNTPAFEKMKQELRQVKQKSEKKEKNAPSLYTSKQEKGCAPPKKLEFIPNQNIEQLCASPRLVTAPKGETPTPPSQQQTPE